MKAMNKINGIALALTHGFAATPVKAVLKPCQLVTLLSLLLLCSCATVRPPLPLLPADVTMNKDAGRGDFLMVTLRLENGEQLPFLVDTGTSITLFDKSLAPQLGKKIGDASMGNPEHWGQHIKSDLYLTQNLYLGNVLLKTSGNKTTTVDLSKLSLETGYPIKGILGMNTLEHYCIQLDFDAGKIRFLDDEKTDKTNWGKAFPIVANNADSRPFVAQNLLGAQGPHALIDSGYPSDGWLRPKSFQQWTNLASPLTDSEAHSPYGVFDGEKYHDVSLNVQYVDDADGIGLNFLARHLVTLDFPKHTLYLKRTSDSPLRDKEAEAALKSELHSVADFARSLRLKGQLPGWTKSDLSTGKAVGHFQHTGELDLVTLDEQKEGDSSVYHFTFRRASRSSPWKLEKTWLTDQSGKSIEEFPVP